MMKTCGYSTAATGVDLLSQTVEKASQKQRLLVTAPPSSLLVRPYSWGRYKSIAHHNMELRHAGGSLGG